MMVSNDIHNTMARLKSPLATHSFETGFSGATIEVTTCFRTSNSYFEELGEKSTVKPVLRGHLWDKEKVAL